ALCGICRKRLLSARGSEPQSQRELDLPRSVSVLRPHEVGWNPVIGREVVDSKPLSPKLELGRIAGQAVVGDLESPVHPVEQVERLGGKVELPPASEAQSAGNSQGRRSVIRACERIPAHSRQTVVIAVAI